MSVEGSLCPAWARYHLNVVPFLSGHGWGLAQDFLPWGLLLWGYKKMCPELPVVFLPVPQRQPAPENGDLREDVWGTKESDETGVSILETISTHATRTVHFLIWLQLDGAGFLPLVINRVLTNTEGNLSNVLKEPCAECYGISKSLPNPAWRVRKGFLDQSKGPGFYWMYSCYN